MFRKGTGFQVAAFTDAGHANEEFVAQENDLGGKSTTGSVIFLNGCVVAWKSKLQTTVADSTGYAENLAAFSTIKECEFIKQFLGEMGIEIGPIPLFADATNTISSLHNSTYKQGGTRHHKIKVSCMYQYVKRFVRKMNPFSLPSRYQHIGSKCSGPQYFLTFFIQLIFNVFMGKCEKARIILHIDFLFEVFTWLFVVNRIVRIRSHNTTTSKAIPHLKLTSFPVVSPHPWRLHINAAVYIKIVVVTNVIFI